MSFHDKIYNLDSTIDECKLGLKNSTYKAGKATSTVGSTVTWWQMWSSKFLPLVHDVVDISLSTQSFTDYEACHFIPHFNPPLCPHLNQLFYRRWLR